MRSIVAILPVWIAVMAVSCLAMGVGSYGRAYLPYKRYEDRLESDPKPPLSCADARHHLRKIAFIVNYSKEVGASARCACDRVSTQALCSKER